MLFVIHEIFEVNEYGRLKVDYGNNNIWNRSKVKSVEHSLTMEVEN